MLTRFPENVIVLDREALLHVRLVRANGSRRPERVRTYRLGPTVFGNGSVTPSVADEEGLRSSVRRVRQEGGAFDATSILLPDSWFRITILELASIPDRRSEADDVIRWTLRRSLPVQSEELRLAWHPIDRMEGKTRILVVGASERSLASIESAFGSEDIRVVLVEPIGISLWNAIAATWPDDKGYRIFFYLREREFTTAVFRGSLPMFVRSKELSAERSLHQEIALSASYVRTRLAASSIDKCWVAGNGLTRFITDTLGREFDAPVEVISISLLAPSVAAAETAGNEAEVAACMGVFTA